MLCVEGVLRFDEWESEKLAGKMGLPDAFADGNKMSRK